MTPRVRDYLPRLIVPTGPMWQFLLRDLIIFIAALGLVLSGIAIEHRIATTQLAERDRVISAQRDELKGKVVADGLASKARTRERRGP